MDNFQKIDQLVNKAGCSYEDAKAALEGNNWDMIDAVISLEREGKVVKTTSGKAENKEADAVEIIPEVVTDKGSGTGRGGAGDTGSSGKTGSGESAPKERRRLWDRIKSILLNNRMVIIRSNGQQLMDVPILAVIIVLVAFFWATIILAVVAMIFGYHFHFEGEDFGKTNINNTMDKATDYAEKVRHDLTGKANGK